jgi:hypothetical protein
MRTSIEAIKNTSFASLENRLSFSEAQIWATHHGLFKPSLDAAHSSMSRAGIAAYQRLRG